MDKITVTIPSRIEHNAQTVAGFLLLKKKGYDVQIINQSGNPDTPFYDCPVVLAEYRGMRILYDHWDGYPPQETMQACLDWSDICFKRSFSPEKNASLFPADAHKIFPLGFNYHVTLANSPINDPLWKAAAKILLGKTPHAYFTPGRFEGEPSAAANPPKIIFFTRLWDPDEPNVYIGHKEERRIINETRIQILRSLREHYGDAFTGGLNDMPFSRKLAPDLIVPNQFTNRKNYLQLLHSADICIGSMGLHESIGWKTAEYVAAAKAIVNETLHYCVPGDFLPGQNYLPWQTAEECLAAVRKLTDDPQLLMNMKQANQKYYQEHLRPDVLVGNTLEIVRNL